MKTVKLKLNELYWWCGS